jgi:hypothetical protein
VPVEGAVPDPAIRVIARISGADDISAESCLCDTRSGERGAVSGSALCPVLHYRADVPGDDEPLNLRGAITLATSESATRTVLFARLAVVAAVAYQLLLIALILVRPEIDPARKPISEYTIGRLGWLAVLGFQISAAA